MRVPGSLIMDSPVETISDIDEFYGEAKIVQLLVKCVGPKIATHTVTH
jgi:hypothetical protein